MSRRVHGMDHHQLMSTQISPAPVHDSSYGCIIITASIVPALAGLATASKHHWTPFNSLTHSILVIPFEPLANLSHLPRHLSLVRPWSVLEVMASPHGLDILRQSRWMW